MQHHYWYIEHDTEAIIFTEAAIIIAVGRFSMSLSEQRTEERIFMYRPRGVQCAACCLRVPVRVVQSNAECCSSVHSFDENSALMKFNQTTVRRQSVNLSTAAVLSSQSKTIHKTSRISYILTKPNEYTPFSNAVVILCLV